MLSDKQIQLLQKIYLPFKEKYAITLNEFTLKFSKKLPNELEHQYFYFLMKKVNCDFYYWADKSIFRPLKINFKNLLYFLEKETNDYIIGKQKHIDKNTIMKIISFKKLLVLDYDNIPLSEIETILQKTNLTFLIYQTKNGFHCYCISHEFDYNNQETLQLMYSLK